MTIKVRIASRAPFTFDGGAGVALTRTGNAVTAELDYPGIAAGAVAGSWIVVGYDSGAEEYKTFSLSAALALSHTHTLAQISDMSANARTFNAAADYAAMRTALGFDEAVDDRVGTLLVAGSGITIAYNDAGNALTIGASGTGGVAFAGLVNNAELSASVGSSALTIALKTHAGADPSSGDPISLAFQAADGSAVTRTLTAATSIVVSSGSTLGTANSTAFRFWVVAFDDAGTVRLGVINCRDSSNNIYPLGGYGIASSTAEGGAGAADSAHVIYTGTAVSSKAYTVIGYVEYTSGLGTAGTYSSGPNRTVLHQRGMKLPGDVVQTKIGTATAEVSHNSTSYTQTNLEVSITLNSPANLVKYVATGPLYALTASGATAAVFAQVHRSGTAIGSAQSVYASAAATSAISSGAIYGFDFPNSASALTYEVYTKTNGAGTTVEYPEQSGGGTVGLIAVEEIMA